MSDPDPGPPPGPARSLLTPRGWALLGVAGVMFLGGLLVRLDELFPVAAAAVVLVAGALSWVRFRPWQVEGHRTVSPARVAQGGVAQVELTVANLDRRTSPVLSAGDPFDGGWRVARFSLYPLAPGATVQARYRLPTAQRGIFALGPIEFRLCDPFGLAAVHRYSGHPASLRVYPAFERIPPLDLREGPGEGSRDNPARLTQRGEEFYALREYQPGDDLRRVHWASSARHDYLMIRQDHDIARGRVLVVGDLRSALHTGASLERTLGVLASLADAGIRGDHSVRVMLTGGGDSQWGDGPGHGAQILDLLAGAAVDRRSEAAALRRTVWEHAPGSSTIVVTTDIASASDVGTARTAQSGREPPVVVVIERGAGRASATPPRRRAVWVPVGVPFAQAWSQRTAAVR